MAVGLKNLSVLVAIAAVYIGIHLSSFQTMAALWQFSAYEHCILIPFVSLTLLYWQRDGLSQHAWQGSWTGLVCLMMGSIVLHAAQQTSVQVVEHAFVILSLVALLWALFGDQLIKVAWFPLGYLLFCLPVGDTLIPALQRVTADISTTLLALFGITSYREGMLITLPGGVFEVARACSGFRYLNAGVALSALVAFMFLKTFRLRLLYVAIAVAVFLLMNGVRAFITILVGSLSELKYMTGDDHIVFGYALFAVAIFLLFKLANRWQRIEAGWATHGS